MSIWTNIASMVLKKKFGFSKIFKKKKLTLLKYFLHKEKQEQKTNKQKLQITIKLITSLTIQAVLYMYILK